MKPHDSLLPWTDRWIIVEGTKPRAGGQGSVKKVREKDSGRLGALKEMLPDPVDRGERRLRMKQEVAGLIKAQGDGVPEFFDSNAGKATDEEELYLVQAWIDGSNLQQSVTKPLTIDQSLQLTLSLARVVQRCHDNGVLHRDIKPENIIIHNNGRLYLVDFGIAWLPPEDRPDVDPTRWGQELGNRFLRLPEMAAGQLRNDPRSDVTFVVGILFFLLTGQSPRTLSFGGDGLPPHKHLRNAFPVATRNDSRMERISSIFEVGFQNVPNLRFQSIDKLINRVEEILDPRPTQATVDEAQAVARYEEMMQERETAQRHAILTSMREAAVAFEQRIRELSPRRHLEPVMMAGSPCRESDSWVTTVRFNHVTGNLDVAAGHKIQMEGSEVVCISTVNGHRTDYYRGPAADSARLKEETDRHVGAFFAQVLQTFVDQANSQRDFMELFE